MGSLDSLFDCAAEDRRHGAAEIEGRLIADLLHERQRWIVSALVSGAERLLAGQPAMANLRNLARVLAGGGLTVIQGWLESRSDLLNELDDRFASSAWPLIEGATRILSISRSSAVASVLEGAWHRGWRGETVVFDGSPAGSGADQATRLAERMDHVYSQPDSSMPGWLTGGKTRVLVGADAVSPQRLVNAGGTRRLLELACSRAVPVVVVADTGKDLLDDEIDLVLASGPEVVDEGTGRRRPLFEAIPFDLVSTRVSE